MPFGNLLPSGTINLITPTGGTRYNWGGSCTLALNGSIVRRNLTLPTHIVEMLPTHLCLPPGALWYVGELPAAINAPEYNWPNKTVLVPPRIVLLPPCE